MKITVVTVGKLKEKYFCDAVSEYAKRLSKYCKLEIFEVPDEKTPDKAGEALTRQIKEREGERILNKLSKDAFVICLAIDGKKLDSVAFADKLEKLGVDGISHLQFIIGGSLGLSDEVLGKADMKLSFSDMTFPHQLMRVILLEQMYRAFRIMNHEPYHK